MEANACVKRYLNCKLKEPYKLVLFIKSVMRLTHNCRDYDGKGTSFNQGQLVVILELPDLQVEESKRYLRVKLVPPGVRNVDVENLPAQ